MVDDRLAELTRLAHTNSILLDAGIRHGVYLARFQTYEARQVALFLRKHAIPDIMQAINNELDNLVDGKLTSRNLVRLSNLMYEVGGITRAGMSSAASNVEDTLRKLAVNESEFVINSINSAVPIQIQLQAPANTLLRQIVRGDVRGAPMRDWFTKLGDVSSQKIERSIRIGLAQGESRRQISTRVRSVINVSQHHAATIARTSISEVSASTREQSYAANDDVIKGVQYVATLDSRTTERCAGLDGTVHAIQEGPRPPQHHSCRSTTVPVLKSWKELGFDLKELSSGQRASMDGQTARVTTMPDWLKRQPANVQNDNLGKKKAQQFRDGTFSFTRYSEIKSLSSPLSLEQMARRDSSFLT